MEAAVQRNLFLFAVALANGSQSCAALANQVQQQAPANDSEHVVSVQGAGDSASERAAAAQIVITGSRIPRTNLTAVSPVTMVEGEEFKLAGATNVEELLNQLPQINPSQGEFLSAGATGAATIDLRGLGSVRTLVLVNGRRLLPGDPRFPVADVNSIPASIIQRVEVLTGGASAAYGSDAVAGVVNFILDTKLDGLKVQAEIGGFQHDNRDKFAQQLLGRRQLPYPKGSIFDGPRENVSVAFGHSFLDNRANITVYGGYHQIAGVTQVQRDYGACPITAKIVDQIPTSVLECGGSRVPYPGNFFDNLGNIYQVTPDRSFVPGIARFNYSPYDFYQRPDKRYSAGGFVSVDVSTAIQAYAEFMYMDDRTLAQAPPSGDFTNTETINCDNPLLSIQQRSLICRTGNFVGEIPTLDTAGDVIHISGSPTPFLDPVTGATYSRAWLLIARRSVESGPIQDDERHRSIRLLGGIKGDLGRGVSYDASYLSGHVILDWQSRNNISITRLGRALDVVSDPRSGQAICRSALIARELGTSAPGADGGCIPWDVFAPGHVTAESLAYLSVPPFMRGSYRQQVGNLNATVQLDRWGIGSPWAKESAAINAGVEYRKDSVAFDPDEFTQSGDVAGFAQQVFPIVGSIQTREIFGEARVPLITGKLVRRFALEGGFRRSWYRNAGTKFSSDAYKLALDLTAVPGFRFRASQQRTNRAPNLQELFAPAQPKSFLRDPCAGTAPLVPAAQCALTGVAPAQYGHVVPVNASIFGYNAISGGNEDLYPETAITRTVGLVLQPRLLRGFDATIDWWDIRLKGAISRIGAQTILDACIATADPRFCSRIHRDPNGSLWLGNGYVDDRQANLGALNVRGIDGSADYSIPLGRLGSAKAEFRGSYVLRWIVDNGGLSRRYDCAGLFGDPCGMQPRWKHTARATWQAPHRVSLSLQWRHIGGVRLAALDPQFNLTGDVSPANTKLRSQDYFDATAAFRLRKRVQLRLGVNNVLDRQPPLVVSNTAAGAGPFNGDTYPGWYDPLGRYVFASVAIEVNP